MSGPHDRRRGRPVRPRPGRGLRHRSSGSSRTPGAGRRPARAAGGRARRLPDDLATPTDAEPPPALDLDGPEIRRLAALAGDMVVCAGFCEAATAGARYNAAVCVHRRRRARPPPQGAPAAERERRLRRRRPLRRLRHSGRPDRHDDLLRQGVPRGGPRAGPRRRRDRRVHVGLAGERDQPGARARRTTAWRRFDLFDRPARWRTRSSWPRRTSPAPSARCASSASAKVVDPGGDSLPPRASRASRSPSFDVAATLECARRALWNLRDLRPDAYRLAAADPSKLPGR